MLQNNYLRIKQLLRAYPKLILLLGKKVKLMLISKISCMIEVEWLRNLKSAVNLVVETKTYGIQKNTFCVLPGRFCGSHPIKSLSLPGFEGTTPTSPAISCPSLLSQAVAQQRMRNMWVWRGENKKELNCPVVVGASNWEWRVQALLIY